MKKLLLLLFISSSYAAFAQINFENGYYINSSGERIQGQIRNVDWKNNPSQFSFRQSENAEARTLSTNEVMEFGINEDIHYVRATVPVDQSSPNLRSLSNHGQFESKEETVFLKTLITGEADLFQLQRGQLQQFFFSVNEEDIQPLIYKRYIPPTTVKIAENKQYQQQLLNALTCEDIGPGDVTRTDYKRTDLVKLFRKYNNCVNSDFRDLTSKAKGRDAFNLSIRPGVNFSSFFMTTYVVQRDLEFDPKTTFRLGLEGEYVLPFFRNKWAFIAEPTYQYYSGEAIFPQGRFEDGKVVINYNSVEFPFGVRHYFFLNNDSRIFLNMTYTVDFVVGDSNVDFQASVLDTYTDFPIETNTGTNFSFGGGFSYKEFSVEARYHQERSLTGKFTMLGSGYNTFSLIFGYNFL